MGTLIFFISGGHLGIQDGRHGTFVFIYFSHKAHQKVIYCEMDINVFILKIVLNDITIIYVDGK